MLLPDGFAQPVELGPQLRHQIGSEDRVALHLAPFLVRERSFLPEDTIRETRHPDVVEKAGLDDLQCPFERGFESQRDLTGEDRHVGGVSLDFEPFVRLERPNQEQVALHHGCVKALCEQPSLIHIGWLPAARSHV